MSDASAPSQRRPSVTVEQRPHYGFVCSVCGPREGMWSSVEDAEWAGAMHLHWHHGGGPVYPLPPSRQTVTKGSGEPS